MEAILDGEEVKPTPEKQVDWQKWLAPLLTGVLAAALVVIAPRVLPSVDPNPPAPIIVPVKVESKFSPADTVVKLNGKRLDDEKTKLYCDAVNNGNGTITLEYTPVGKETEYRTIVVSEGISPLPPAPPGPGPKPPEPPKPDVVGGPRGILIVQQVENESDAFSAMMIKLRSGASADYLKSKGHKLYHLDPDDTGANGQASAIVEAWRPHFKDKKLPVEIIFDPATKQMLSTRELPDTTTDANVIESVRQQGG